MIDTFRFGVLSDDPVLIDAFVKGVKDKYLRKKPVKLLFTKEISDYSLLQAIFIDSKYNTLLHSIVKRIQNKDGVLIITTNSQELLLSMINIYKGDDDTNFKLQVNKQNLDDKGFRYKPELLFYGGSLVDIKKLYMSTLELLINKNHQIDSINNSLNVLKEKSEVYKTQINVLGKSMDSIKRQVLLKEKEMYLLSLEKTKLKDDINNRDLQLYSLNKVLLAQEKKRALVSQKLEAQMDSIFLSEVKLKNLTSELEEKRVLIDESTQQIGNQLLKIETQKKGILILTSIGITLVIAVLLIIKAFRSNLKLTKKLNTQKVELERTLAKLKQAQYQLIESEKMSSLGMLTAGIAHEINNPVNFISSGNQALKIILEEFWQQLDDTVVLGTKKGEGKSIQQFKNEIEQANIKMTISEIIDNIELGIQRTAEIVNSLQEYSRGTESENTTFNITNCIGDALILLKYKSKYKVEIEKYYDEIPKISSSFGKLNQVFVNVLSNAFDAIDTSGLVRIETNYINEEEAIEIKITDNGAGISQKNITKVFNPFFTTKEQGKGTGLGMYISYGFIKQLGGTINIKSKTGEGTQVTIKLPITT